MRRMYELSPTLDLHEIMDLPTRVLFRTMDHKIWEGYTSAGEYGLRLDTSIRIYPATGKEGNTYIYSAVTFIEKMACSNMEFHPNLSSEYWKSVLKEIEERKAIKAKMSKEFPT